MPLGGSVRASRAARLACPSGPLAAVDLADGRPLLAELRGSVWVAVPPGEAAVELPGRGGAEVARAATSPARRHRLGTVVALAAALGAAAVALTAGFSGSPPPAVAGPAPATGGAGTPVPVAALPARARGGRAIVRPAMRAVPPAPAPPSPPPAPPPAPVAPPPIDPAPPPLPELPRAPAL